MNTYSKFVLYKLSENVYFIGERIKSEQVIKFSKNSEIVSGYPPF